MTRRKPLQRGEVREHRAPSHGHVLKAGVDRGEWYWNDARQCYTREVPSLELGVYGGAVRLHGYKGAVIVNVMSEATDNAWLKVDDEADDFANLIALLRRARRDHVHAPGVADHAGLRKFLAKAGAMAKRADARAVKPRRTRAR